MKRFTMMLVAAGALSMGAYTNASAQGTRGAVILEIATGTWCQYCPGAAMGADDLHASSASVGVVEHHDNDPYSTPDAVARYDTYYGVTGFPTAFFDGANSVVGGSNSTSLYASYLPKYTTAMAVATPFDLTATWTQNGASIDVAVTVTQVGANSSSAIRVQAALTESHIAVNWQGQTECNFVNRAMHPSAAGTPISTTMGGPAATLNFNMPISPSWVQSDMELVVWVEDGTTKQIWNGRYMPLAVATMANDPSAIAVENEIGATSCITSIAPEVKIRNMGSAALTTVDFTYNVNGGTAMTHSATITSLNFLGYATVTLPAISFTSMANNTLTVNITNSNDGNMANNMVTKSWAAAASHAAGAYNLLIQPDNYGSETTWEVKNGAGAVIASGGPYTDGNTTPVNVPITINPLDCYELIVMDAYGDGMCCQYGNGSFTLTSPSGGVVATGGSFSASVKKSWESSTASAVNNALTEAISVYPNPTRGIFNIAIPSGDAAEISIMNVAGMRVYSSNTEAAVVKVDLSGLAAGMYMVHVKTAEGIAVKKITKE